MGAAGLGGGLKSMDISNGGFGLLGFGLGFPAGEAMGGGSGVDLEKWEKEEDGLEARRSTSPGEGGGGDCFLPFAPP
jgi:hypothetical protein